MLCYRALRLKDPLTVVAVGTALGWVVALMVTNCWLLLGFEVGRAIWLTLGLEGLSAVILATRGRPRWERLGLSRASWAFLLVGAGLVHFYVASTYADDDFFLHAPMQAQLLHGTFPVVNPFFPEVSYGGHYARDLLIVMWAETSGWPLYTCQTPVTSLLQVVSFLVLYLACLRQTDSQTQACLATSLVFAGVNAGFRGGWIDTVTNNNAIAHLTFSLCFFLLLEALFKQPSPAASTLAGVALGGFAWAYETDFVMTALALCLLAATVALWNKLERRQLLTAAVIVAVSAPLAAVQGGLLKNLVDKVTRPAPAEPLDPILQSQNLEVSLRFPKENLGAIKLERGEGEELSLAYQTLPGFRHHAPRPQRPGYVNVFSWSVLRIHWLPLYLAPLTLIWLWRRRHPTGLLLWYFGLMAYMLPALIDFGLWEAEVFRFEYAASWGFAGALGLALGDWFEQRPGPGVLFRAGCLELGPRGLAGVVTALLVWASLYPSAYQLTERRSHLRYPTEGLAFESLHPWAERRANLNLYPADIDCALWLGRNLESGDGLLTNFREEGPSNVLFEAAFLGLCGAQPLGHAFPLPHEALGTWPFRQTAPARAFWQSLDTSLLVNFEARWLFVRGAPEVAARLGSQLELAYQSQDRYLFACSIPKVELPASDGQSPLVAENLVLPEKLPIEAYRQLEFTLSNPSSQTIEGHYLYYELSSGDGLIDPRERFLQPIDLKLRPGQSQQVALHLVTPHLEGDYQLQLYLDGKALAMSRAPLTVKARTAFGQLAIAAATPLDPTRPGQLQRYRIQLSAPLPVEVLAGLQAGAEEPGLHEWRDYRRLPAGASELELAVSLPPQPGPVRVWLLLLPRDGAVVYELPVQNQPVSHAFSLADGYEL